MFEIKKMEQLFFKILGDMEEYLPYFVLVGGWVPYLYVKYLWKNLNFYPVTTTDVDFGISESREAPSVKECLYLKLSKLKYKERHIDMGRMFPIVPIAEDPKNRSRLSIEFITGTGTDNEWLSFNNRYILLTHIRGAETRPRDTYSRR